MGVTVNLNFQGCINNFERINSKMDYSKIYYNLIEHRKQNSLTGYVEQHHIIPKSLGGPDSPDNLVDLSAREHFVAHLLLTKMYSEGTPNYFKMIKAFMMMLTCKSESQERFLSSKKYETIRTEFAKAQSLSQTGSGNSQFGKPRSEETKQKISQSLLEKTKDVRKDILNKKIEIQKIKEQKQLNEVDLYRKYYIIYSKVGWGEFVNTTGYKYSKPNLVSRFAKLLPEFVPQNGKIRGK